MSGRYYYFAATLPSLQLAAPAPMASAEFLERAARHLAREELLLLSEARLLSDPDQPAPLAAASPFLESYYSWERCVRNELARLRARRLGRSAEDWVRPARREDSAPRAALAIFSAESPLEGELLLERERWAFIERLRGLQTFGLESLLAYRLQLQILERLSRLRSEAGEAGYRKTYADILEPAQSSDMTGVPR